MISCKLSPDENRMMFEMMVHDPTISLFVQVDQETIDKYRGAKYDPYHNAIVDSLEKLLAPGYYSKLWLGYSGWCREWGMRIIDDYARSYTVILPKSDWFLEKYIDANYADDDTQWGYEEHSFGYNPPWEKIKQYFDPFEYQIGLSSFVPLKINDNNSR